MSGIGKIEKLSAQFKVHRFRQAEVASNEQVEIYEAGAPNTFREL